MKLSSNHACILTVTLGSCTSKNGKQKWWYGGRPFLRASLDEPSAWFVVVSSKSVDPGLLVSDNGALSLSPGKKHQKRCPSRAMRRRRRLANPLFFPPWACNRRVPAERRGDPRRRRRDNKQAFRRIAHFSSSTFLLGFRIAIGHSTSSRTTQQSIDQFFSTRGSASSSFSASSQMNCLLSPTTTLSGVKKSMAGGGELSWKSHCSQLIAMENSFSCFLSATLTDNCFRLIIGTDNGRSCTKHQSIVCAYYYPETKKSRTLSQDPYFPCLDCMCSSSLAFLIPWLTDQIISESIGYCPFPISDSSSSYSPTFVCSLEDSVSLASLLLFYSDDVNAICSKDNDALTSNLLGFSHIFDFSPRFLISCHHLLSSQNPRLCIFRISCLYSESFPRCHPLPYACTVSFPNDPWHTETLVPHIHSDRFRIAHLFVSHVPHSFFSWIAAWCLELP